MIDLDVATLKSQGEKIQTLPIPEVYSALGTRPQGLTQSEATTRLQQFGRNALQEIKGKPLYLKLLSNFTHLMAILLWVGGAVALFAKMPQLAIAIWMVNVINGAFSFWQEYRAEKATEALKRLMPIYSRVLRDGEVQRILAEELVSGDVILLEEGDKISADCRLIQEAELRVDQSTLTGESRPIRKTVDRVELAGLARIESPNLIFAGTMVNAGVGKAIVFSTGMSTEFGKIANLTQSVSEELSPLQAEMNVVTKVVTVIAVVVGLVFFALAFAFAHITLMASFIFTLGIIVAFVPEGLLPTVSLSLAMGAQRMAKRNALIKKLSAVETLGCATVICTDKTGTLTQNEMTTREIWLPAGRNLTVSGVGYISDGQILESGKIIASNDDLRQLLVAASLCNNSRLLPPNDSTNRWSILGDPTEAALKVAAVKGGVNLETEERDQPRWRELPFDSRRKRMTTIHSLIPNPSPAGEGSRPPLPAGEGLRVRECQVAYIKGSPKEMLELCNRVRVNGAEYPLDENGRSQALAMNDEYARNGLRVLAIARRELPPPAEERLKGEARYSSEAVETNLTLLGLVALMDPPRPEVADAIEKCRRAGIRVIMITGDYGLTAESIARKIGIIRSERPRIVTGLDLDGMDEQTLKDVLQDEVIFARVAPEHKLRVVSALQELGHVAAVTGDGVNDAPALKKANIGVAMGLSGSDVAKEAADMILTDDNFASIVNAIEEGRAVYANIKKFTTYVFASNAPEAWVFIIFAFSGARIPLALNVMHVLAIDLGTDMAPALALGAEPPEPEIMNKPPRNLNEHVITAALLTRVFLWVGMVETVAAMSAFYYMYWTNGYWGQWLDLPATGTLYQSATAMALAAVVTTQIGNLFAQRSETISAFRIPLFNNRMIWFGIITELILIILITYVDWFHGFIGTAAFPIQNWIFLFAWTPILLLVDEIYKWTRRSRL